MAKKNKYIKISEDNLKYFKKCDIEDDYTFPYLLDKLEETLLSCMPYLKYVLNVNVEIWRLLHNYFLSLIEIIMYLKHIYRQFTIRKKFNVAFYLTKTDEQCLLKMLFLSKKFLCILQNYIRKVIDIYNIYDYDLNEEYHLINILIINLIDMLEEILDINIQEEFHEEEDLEN